jgi:hypothetical protein
MKSGQKPGFPEIRRHAVVLGGLLLMAVAVGLLITLSMGSNPTYDPASRTIGDTRAPVSSNNYRADNANMINRQRSGSSNASSAPGGQATPGQVEPISQTTNGYTVTLYPLYANASRIVLTYSVQSAYEDLSTISPFEPLRGEDRLTVFATSTPMGPSAHPMSIPSPTIEAYEPILAGAYGGVFPWVRDAGWQIPKAPGSAPLVFDSRQLGDNLPRELRLRLELNKAEVWIVDSSGGATLHQIKGPFSFDFSMPVDPVRRIVDVNLRASTRDGDIILKRVVVTRHEVRTIWTFDKSRQPQRTPTAWPYGYGMYACCSLKLEVGGESVDFATAWGGSQGGDDIVSASLLDEQGEWTISAWYVSTWMGNMYYPPQPGPEFHFIVPPATNSPRP